MYSNVCTCLLLCSRMLYCFHCCCCCYGPPLHLASTSPPLLPPPSFAGDAGSAGTAGAAAAASPIPETAPTPEADAGSEGSAIGKRLHREQREPQPLSLAASRQAADAGDPRARSPYAARGSRLAAAAARHSEPPALAGRMSQQRPSVATASFLISCGPVVGGRRTLSWRG